MSARREFPTAVRMAVIKRAAEATGFIACEQCGALAKRNWQIDHVRPDGMGGEPTLANAMLICEACWKVKNPADASAIAAAKRREAAHLNAKRRPKAPLKSGATLAGPEKAHEGRAPAVGLSEIARRWGIK